MQPKNLGPLDDETYHSLAILLNLLLMSCLQDIDKSDYL